MAEAGEPLMRVYYENCPGCKQDKINEQRQGFPFKEFAYIWQVVQCTCLPIACIYPFLYFMIRDFQIAKSDEDIGYYAGLLGSSFMIGRALTSMFWGAMSDRHGRKPIMMLGIISVVIFNTVFGFSMNFWMAISMRFLLGSFNGLLGPTTAYASEVCRKEYQAMALSIISTSWGVALVIGPALGGLLAQPAEKYPSIFSECSLFGRFPYLLPCLCMSLFALAVSVACIWLPESLHMHNGKGNETCRSYDAEEAAGHVSDWKEKVEDAKGGGSYSKGNLFKNWPLMSSIIVYCVFSLHDMAYTEIFSLWAVSDKSFGGLNFSSEDVGEVLAISGFGLLLFQHFVYPLAEKKLGSTMVARIAAILSIPLLSSFPFIAKLSGFSLTLAINCASLLQNVLAVAVVTGLYVLQNNAVPQHQRGAANGISLTAMSIFKAAGPAAGGALFAWAQSRQDASFLPGDEMVFFMLNVVDLIGLLLTFLPSVNLPK